MIWISCQKEKDDETDSNEEGTSKYAVKSIEKKKSLFDPSSQIKYHYEKLVAEKKKTKRQKKGRSRRDQRAAP